MIVPCWMCVPEFGEEREVEILLGSLGRPKQFPAASSMVAHRVAVLACWIAIAVPATLPLLIHSYAPGHWPKESSPDHHRRPSVSGAADESVLFSRNCGLQPGTCGALGRPGWLQAVPDRAAHCPKGKGPFRGQHLLPPSSQHLPSHSGIVPYKIPKVCLAWTPQEVLHLCHVYMLGDEYPGLGFNRTLPPIEQGRPPFAQRSLSGPESRQGPGREADLVVGPRVQWRGRFPPLRKFAEHFEQNETQNARPPGKFKENEIGEWLNFADAHNGAKVVGANVEARKATSAIDGKSDSFMKNDCKAQMWIVVELSQIARIKVVELTMKELYSSRIADFQVFGKLQHPGKNLTDYPGLFGTPQWLPLGNFTAENRKGHQQFAIHQGRWIRYMGIHFVSYHGTESACTINEVSVYGVTPEQDLQALQVDESEEAKAGHTAQEPLDTPADPDAAHIQVSEPDAQDSLPPNATSPPVGGNETGGEDPLPVVSGEQELSNEGEKEGESPGRVVVQDPPALSAYKKIKQDVQSLKRNSSILANYVDQLHSGLMQTIDELWGAAGEVQNRTKEMKAALAKVHTGMHAVEQRMDTLETALQLSLAQSKLMAGSLGLGAFVAGVLALRSSMFSKSSAALSSGVLAFSAMNFLVGVLNITCALSPSVNLAFGEATAWVVAQWDSIVQDVIVR